VAMADSSDVKHSKRSFLDVLQKDAHRSELDYTNTPPHIFLLLSLLQVPVTQLIAASCSVNFQIAAALGIGSHWLGFVIGPIMLGTNRWFDITEDISFFLMMLWSLSTVPGEPSSRQLLVFGGALLWCVRLCAFVGWRVIVRGSDFRFDKLLQDRAYGFFGWTSGGTWCFMNGFCLWAVAERREDATLDSLDALGLLLWAIGLTCETVADVQKYKFNQNCSSGTNTQWIDTGLWKYSRHPNYAGEMTLWLGLAITSIGGWTELTIQAAFFACITPLWSFFFLLFTSLMLLEKKADEKWAGEIEYELYKDRTSVLMLWPPKSMSKHK